MSDEDILKLRDPNHIYYKSLIESIIPCNLPEFFDYYGNNVLLDENIMYWIRTSTNMEVLCGLLDYETNDFCITVRNTKPLLFDEKENKYNINPNYRSIRINIINPSYQKYSEDLFTKIQKDDFTENLILNWKEFRLGTLLTNTNIIIDQINFNLNYYNNIVNLFGKDIVPIIKNDPFSEDTKNKIFKLVDSILPKECPNYSLLPIKE